MSVKKELEAAGAKVVRIPSELIEMPESSILIERLAALGYTFRLNLCSDTIECSSIKLSDIIAAEIRMQLRDNGMGKKIKAAEDAYAAHARRNSYHPIREYLDSLVWDGGDHIIQLTTKMESADTPIVYSNGDTIPLHAVYLYRFLIGAVAKVYEQAQLPMLVLDGPQNLGKSTLVRWLCPLPNYFIEGPIRVEDKDTEIRLIDRWIWEVSELDATTRKADQSAIKAFITKKEVTVRKAYGRYEITKPAMAAMIGTVNNSTGFLSDETGNRRFMITLLTKIDFRYTQIDINQVWAQAVALYRDGTTWRLLGQEKDAQTAINKRYETETTLADWLDKYFIFDPEIVDTHFSMADILDKMDEYRSNGSDRAMAMELARVLTGLGAQRVHTRNGKRWIGMAVRPK